MADAREHIKYVKNLLDQVNSLFIAESDIDFFKVQNYDGKTLHIIAGRELTVAHNLELQFENVTFFKGDFEWSRNDEKPLIHLAEIEEKPGSLRFKFMLESDGYYYSNHNHKIEIWAEDFSYDTTTVYYWNKQDLQEGERIAAWVKRSE